VNAYVSCGGLEESPSRANIGQRTRKSACHCLPLPGETTRPYSEARLRRWNMRQAAREIFPIASSPWRAFPKNTVITQMEFGDVLSSRIPIHQS
jgi:hypothetical protein